MISLDGVMQAPGGPEEDTSGGFKYGGWVAPYGDEAVGKVFEKLTASSDILIGRHTFDIWENYWPKHESGWPGINDVTKYVMSTTRNKTNWQNTIFLKDLSEITDLKKGKPGKYGADIQVWGSSKLIQLLLHNDLVDEMWILTYPLTLGKGKRLFEDGPIPAAFKLSENTVTSKGVIVARYIRAGEVKTGTVGA